eukprot:5581958-Pyramimonas_sp.AAC.1
MLLRPTATPFTYRVPVMVHKPARVRSRLVITRPPDGCDACKSSAPPQSDRRKGHATCKRNAVAVIYALTQKRVCRMKVNEGPRPLVAEGPKPENLKTSDRILPV